MRRTAFALLLTVPVAFSACAIVDSVTTGLRAVGRYANGIVRGKGEVVDGQQQGDWEYLSDDGRVRARGRYEDDEQIGVWTYYYENGQKEYEGLLVNEQRTGRFEYWHPNGYTRALGSFVEGREFGEWAFWNTRGNLIQRGPFVNGLRSGRWVSHHTDGTLAATGLYLEGRQVGIWHLRSAAGEESVAWSPMPDGYEWIEDTWEDGTKRRDGFRVLGRATGLWTLRDRSGDPRLVGTLENGIPQGHWVAFGDAQEQIGEGTVELGRPVGSWKIRRGGTAVDVDASGFSPSMPFAGTWSGRDLVRLQGVEGALSIWLSEASAPIDETMVAMMEQPEDAAGDDALSAADVEPDVPVMAQPWTEFELSNFDLLVEAYTRAGAAVKQLRSRYARASGPSSSGLALPDPGGDLDVAARFVGKPLGLTVFKTPDGDDFDLGTLRGQKVVLVILRGYEGKVCVYCTAQTKALCQSGAFKEFEELGARLQIVFPGEKNGLAAFQAAYDSLSDEQIPPYGLLYENDYIIGPLLHLEGSKVIPSTFILDEAGIVRFAYIGKSAEDRPPVELLVGELKKLNN